jgi:uncharacterized protein (DUF1501 family)
VSRSTQSRREVLKAATVAAGLHLASERPLLAGPPSRKVVLVLLRGGADGLSMLVPHAEPAYYRARPRTSIAPPSRRPDAAIDLDGRFGLHPELAPILPLRREGILRIAVGVGLADAGRSHLEAQRALDAAAREALGPLQSTPPSPLDVVLPLLAQRLVSEPSGEGAWVVESRGWDTHAAQNARMAPLLGELARGLAGFAAIAGNHLDEVALVVLTEFGRSLTETPMAGTDDGGGSIALLLGGRIEKGGISGRWPGLDAPSLDAGRRVAVTMDMRDLFLALSPPSRRRA